MSVYNFAPSPTFGVSEVRFASWVNAFTPEECNKIIELCNQFTMNKATAGGYDENSDYTNVRESTVSWLKLTPESEWIYDRLAWIARNINGEFYKFDLYGFSEHMQFTIYEGENSGHFTWHTDVGAKFGTPPRKLSMIVQLDDPSNYEGGELQIWTGPNPEPVKKEQGLVVAFPSYSLHRVTPVTSGIRRTLVVWVCGPAFK